MNYKDYIVYDFETTSANPMRTQPVQIAALAINGRTLEIKPDSEFESLIKPVFDEEECEALGIDALQAGAVKVHGKTKEILKNAPSLKSVWANFEEYVCQYNYKGKSNFTAPVSVGYNIKGFDNKITQRICCEEPWKLGPGNKRGDATIFNSIYSIDVLDLMFILFENNRDVNSLSFDNLVRGYMGANADNAHDAMVDVRQTADLFCRTMRLLRKTASRTKFKNAFSQ